MGKPETNREERMSNIYLICDDNVVNNDILRRMLEKSDREAVVLTANKGTECIDAYISLIDSNYTPRAIFLDQRMPNMTGVEVARVLSSNKSNMPVDHYEGPIFLVTAEDNLKELRGTNLFKEVVQKPLTMDTIRRLVEGCK